MSQTRKHRKPVRRTPELVLFVIALACLLAIPVILYPVPCVLGALAALWITHHVRKAHRAAKRLVRRF